MTDRLIRVLTVDDHAVLREGIATVVNAEPDMQVVGEAENGQRGVAQFEALQPDVTLLDLQMPVMGGLEALEAMRKLSPTAKLIVLTTYDGDAQAVRALKAGAQGYLLKTSLRRELVDTIRLVFAGKRYVLPEVAQGIALHAAQDPLSDREIQVLERVAAGQANKSIAWDLSVSEDTVKAHMRSIFGKLGVSDRTQAVTLALKRGIISL
jgi:DNA-binding NarL/FixJ family response regulator